MHRPPATLVRAALVQAPLTSSSSVRLHSAIIPTLVLAGVPRPTSHPIMGWSWLTRGLAVPAGRFTASRQPDALKTFGTASSASSTASSSHFSPLHARSSPSSHFQSRSYSSSTSSSDKSGRRVESESESESDDSSKVPLTQRIKYLFRKHGWTALVVYLLLSAVDFAACFLVISAIGADRVRDAEDWVLAQLSWRRASSSAAAAVASAAHHPPRGADAHPSPAAAQAVSEGAPRAEVIEADRKARSPASTYATTAVLAYAVHKTLLLPFRVGVTVAVTPRVVRTLQSWGWKVGMAAGAPPTASAAAARAAGKAASD